MKKPMLLLCVTAALATSAGTAWADTHFVDPTGSDAGNDCTVAASPCATIAHAISEATAGDTVDVAAGTYAETITFGNAFSTNNLTISGSTPTRPSVTGGVNFQNTGAFSGLTLQNLYLTGDGGANRIVNMGNPGAVNDFTMDNCVLDGKDDAGRHAFYGANLGGFLTVTGCEFKDAPGFSTMDIAAAGGILAKTTITFTGNNIHDCEGYIAFRGDAGRVPIWSWLPTTPGPTSTARDRFTPR